MSFIFGSMSQRLQSRNHESDNTSCYHVSCFGHGSCIKELADGASLLDPKHSGKLDDGPRPSGINYNIARFIGSIPSFYETGSGEINDLSVIQEETPIAAECDHLACVNLVTCLYMQGKAEIRKILKTPHTTLPKYLLDQQLQIDRDCFNWNDNKGWAFILKCGKCRHERCSKCEMKVFEELDLLGDKLNAMTDTSIVCGPCIHQYCKGWRIKYVTKCVQCGHLACEDCFDIRHGRRRKEAKCCRVKEHKAVEAELDCQ